MSLYQFVVNRFLVILVIEAHKADGRCGRHARRARRRANEARVWPKSSGRRYQA